MFTAATFNISNESVPAPRKTSLPPDVKRDAAWDCGSTVEHCWQQPSTNQTETPGKKEVLQIPTTHSQALPLNRIKTRISELEPHHYTWMRTAALRPTRDRSRHRSERTPVLRTRDPEGAEVTGFQQDQLWMQGQRGRCLFSIVPFARLTGWHTPSSAEKEFGF